MVVIVVREVHRAELVQVGELLVREDVLGDPIELLLAQRLGVERLERAAEADLGLLPGLQDEVRRGELDRRTEELPQRVACGSLFFLMLTATWPTCSALEWGSDSTLMLKLQRQGTRFERRNRNSPDATARWGPNSTGPTTPAPVAIHDRDRGRTSNWGRVIVPHADAVCSTAAFPGISTVRPSQIGPFSSHGATEVRASPSTPRRDTPDSHEAHDNHDGDVGHAIAIARRHREGRGQHHHHARQPDHTQGPRPCNVPPRPTSHSRTSPAIKSTATTGRALGATEPVVEDVWPPVRPLVIDRMLHTLRDLHEAGLVLGVGSSTAAAALSKSSVENRSK